MANLKQKNTVKEAMMATVKAKLEENGEEILRVKSGTFAIPFVYDDGEEGFLTLTFSIPSGTRDGEAYDGYEEANSYAIDMKEKEEKAKAAAEAKAKKVAKDEKRRADAAAKKAARTATAE